MKKIILITLGYSLLVLGVLAASDLTDIPVSSSHHSIRLIVNDNNTLIETDVAALESATGTVNSAITVLQTATGSLDTAVTTLETATNTLDTAVTALETSTNTLDVAVTALETATNTIQDAVDSIETNITAGLTASGVTNFTVVNGFVISAE